MTRFTYPAGAAELSHEEQADLVRQVEGGIQAACARLVALFGPQMRIVARRFLRCDDDCNDAVQEAFVSAFNAIGRFDNHSRLSTWLYRITVNSCLMKLRADSSRREISFEEIGQQADRRSRDRHDIAGPDDPSSEIETDEMRSLIHRAIDKLPPADRAVLLLRDIQQLDASTTAARLGTSVHNVKRRLRRARQVLSSQLESHMQPIPSSNTRLSSACI
jgi:RNA polymerase sigma-70 factor (ECF subfamily)